MATDSNTRSDSAKQPHLIGWRLSAGDEHRVFDATGNRIADVPCGGLSGRTFDEAADAARLIAAAPMLKDAVGDAVEAFTLLRLRLADEPEAVALIDTHVSELLYAIASAEGIPA